MDQHDPVDPATDDRAHLTSAPDGAGLARMASALGGGTVEEITGLGGGLDSATHRFILRGRRFVLKRFRPDHEDASVEYENLRQARRSRVNTPEPVAVATPGEWFETHSLVMTALDGSPSLMPQEPKIWFSELAAALAAIHDTPIDGCPRGEPLWQRWEPWTDDPRLTRVVEAVEILRGIAGTEPEVFSHKDFHPGNALFDADRLTGIVDWRYAGCEPRQAAVAYCRKDLAIHPGGDAPDRFLAAYEVETGIRLDHMALWDALYGTRALEYGHRWAPSFLELGVNVTAADIHAASAAFVDRALARAGIA